MPDDARSELIAQISHLLGRVEDDTDDPVARIATVVAVNPYLEALTRHLVIEARDEGVSWADIADVFVTTPQNVEQRFGSVRRYDDD